MFPIIIVGIQNGSPSANNVVLVVVGVVVIRFAIFYGFFIS